MNIRGWIIHNKGCCRHLTYTVIYTYIYIGEKMKNSQKKMAVVLSMLIFTLSANLTKAEDLKQEAIQFANQVFTDAMKIIDADNEAIMLNGKDGQEGFCQLVERAVNMKSIIPNVVGKKLFESSSTESQLAFKTEANTHLAKFITLGFMNLDSESKTTFEATQENDKRVSIKVIFDGIDNGTLLKVVKVKSNKNSTGELRLTDIVSSGISFMHLKANEFRAVTNSVDSNKLEKLIKVLNDSSNTSKPTGKCSVN
jgi:ABC-type transporter MlaC component